MKTIQLDLPDPVIAYIRSLDKAEETFAEEAIHEKIAREKKDNLAALLKEGYLQTSQEDLAISNEFQVAEQNGQ